MEYNFEICDKYIKPKSKYKHFKSSIQKQFDRCKHIKLTIENPNMKNIDKSFNTYIIERNKKMIIISLNVNLK